MIANTAHNATSTQACAKPRPRQIQIDTHRRKLLKIIPQIAIQTLTLQVNRAHGLRTNHFIFVFAADNP